MNKRQLKKDWSVMNEEHEEMRMILIYNLYVIQEKPNIEKYSDYKKIGENALKKYEDNALFNHYVNHIVNQLIAIKNMDDNDKLMYFVESGMLDENKLSSFERHVIMVKKLEQENVINKFIENLDDYSWMD